MHRNRLALLVTLLLAVAGRPADAQTSPAADGLLRRRWTIADGLPQSSVTELVRDDSGFVWGATFGGLFRFDGERFDVFDLARLPEMQGNAVSALALAGDGGLWVGTLDGVVVKLRDDHVERALPSAPLGARPVETLFEGPDGTLWAWLGTALASYRDGAWRVWSDHPSPIRRSVGLMRLRDGRVLATGPDGVEEATSRGLFPHRPDRPELRQPAQAAREDRAGRLWIGLRPGALVVDGARVRRIDGVGVINSIVEDAVGDVWLAGDNGIYRIRGGATGDLRPEPIELGVGVVQAMLVTDDGVLLAGSFGQGLLGLRPRPMRRIGRAEGLPDAQVGSLAPDGTGGVWAVSGCAELVRVDVTPRLRETVSLATRDSACVLSLARDSHGHLWAGQTGRVVRRAPDGGIRTWVLPATAEGEPAGARPLVPVGDSVFIGLNDGRLAVATDSSVALLPGWVPPVTRPVTSLLVRRDGTIWVGYPGLLVRWRAGRATRYGAEQGVPSGQLRVLREGDGGLWLGSYGGGLVWLHPDSSRVVRLGLPDASLSGVAEDSAGNFWLLQNRGITLVTRAMRQDWLSGRGRRVDLRLFSASEGVAEGNNGSPAVAEIDGGWLAFGTVDGLVFAQPSDLGHAPEPKSARLEIVRPARTAAWPAGTFPIGTTNRSIDARIVVPLFSEPGTVRTRYRIDSRDDDWNYIGDQRLFQIAALAAGTHTLRAEWRTFGGNWHALPPVRIEVAARWYETRAARLLGLVAAVLGIRLLISRRLARLQARNRALQEEIRFRREAAETMHRHRRELAHVGRVALAGELTATLAHEMGQPLAAMVNNAEAARRLLEQGRTPVAEIGDVLREIVAQGTRASEVIRGLRRFLRRETNGRERIAVREMLAEVAALARGDALEADVEVEVRVEPGTADILGERVLLQQVLLNLVTNAVDAAAGRLQRRVLVRARSSGNGVRFTVADTGPGIPQSRRAQLFDAFVTEKSAGLGLGLSIARRIVDAHEAMLQVGRAPGGGAAFSFRIASA
jgi:signal transduction histidine kinase/ligand-binding sensor domain-containing protein